jgi:Mce-associated membrane protein
MTKVTEETAGTVEEPASVAPEPAASVPEPASEPAPDAASGPPSGPASGVRNRAWVPRLVGAVVAMALAAACTTAVLQWRQAAALAEEKASRRAVATAAASFGRALLSYDYRDLQAARDRVLALAGEDFAKTYDEAFTGGLEGVIAKLHASAVATARDVYVAEIDGSRAKAVAVFDSQVTSDTGTRRMLGTYLEMKLVESRGNWVVDEVNAVGATSETITRPDGTVVPSDAVPTPSPSP